MIELFLYIRLCFGILGGFLATSAVLHFPVFKKLSREYKGCIITTSGTVAALTICVFNGAWGCDDHYWFAFALILVFGLLFPFTFIYEWKWGSIATAIAAITILLGFSEKFCGLLKILLDW